MKDNEKKIRDAQDTAADASGKGRNVNRAASRRGVNLSAGERVEARTQVVGTGSVGNVMTNTYTDHKIVQTAEANPIDKFELGIREAIESLMIQRMSENDEIVSRYMDDQDFQNAIFPLLAKEIFTS